MIVIFKKHIARARFRVCAHCFHVKTAPPLPIKGRFPCVSQTVFCISFLFLTLKIFLH